MDALVFDTDAITVENITELKEYHGLHVSFVGYLDRTKIPIGIDIGFGDVIYPDAMDWIKAFVCPLLEGMEKTKWNPKKGIWE